MMKKVLIFLSFLIYTNLNADENLKFYIKKALENNIKLNAERKSLESSKQSKNISRSEFFPSITLSGDQTSTTSTNRTDQSGANLSDSSLDSESTTISLEQKIFQDLKELIPLKNQSLRCKELF